MAPATSLKEPILLLRDYFLLGLKAGLGKKLYWMNKLFYEIHGADKLYGYALEPYFKDDKMFFNKDGLEIELTDYKPNQSPLHFRDEFILLKGEIENYKGDEPLVTTYGNVFVNYLCLVLPFGDLYEFQTGVFDFNKIEKQLTQRLMDDPDDLDYNKPEMAEQPNHYVWQHQLFCDHALFTVGFSDGYVTTTTERSILGSPNRNKVRDQWLKENSHRLNSPEAVAELSKLLKDLDDEYMAGDESLGYYKASSKASKARRKMHYFFGGEDPFGDGTNIEMIPKSLEEGVDIDKIPVMNSTARAGSYNRGAETALGGVATKVMYRMAGTIRIVEDDCKSPVGVPTLINSNNVNGFMGNYYLENGITKPVAEQSPEGLLGKTLLIRSPITCRTEGKNLCKICAGDNLAVNPDGIPAAVASMGGVMMMIFMKAMHSNEISVRPWDFERNLN